MKNETDCTDPCRGFTLIELLTVIFIIGVLAAIIIPALSRARERAKVTGAEADLRSLATALGDYQIDHTTLPPITGCPVRDIGPGNPAPYIARLGLIGQDMRTKFNDRWSASEDLNNNDAANEPFSTPGEQMAEDQPRFIIRDNITKQGAWELNGRADRGPVPYQYFPVSSDNLRKFRNFLAANNPNDPRADNHYDISILTRPVSEGGAGIPALRDERDNIVGFDTPVYDKYVLFSLGPDGTDHDIIPRNATTRDELRLRAYYRATFDGNSDEILDFNFRHRTKGTGYGPLPDLGKPYKRGDSGIIILTGP